MLLRLTSRGAAGRYHGATRHAHFRHKKKRAPEANRRARAVVGRDWGTQRHRCRREIDGQVVAHECSPERDAATWASNAVRARSRQVAAPETTVLRACAACPGTVRMRRARGQPFEHRVPDHRLRCKCTEHPAHWASAQACERACASRRQLAPARSDGAAASGAARGSGAPTPACAALACPNAVVSGARARVRRKLRSQALAPGGAASPAAPR